MKITDNEDIESEDQAINNRNRLYWEQYYVSAKKEAPSTFCKQVNKILEDKYLILDIGCGSARDSFEFANANHEVIGIDSSKKAIEFANSVIEKEGYINVAFQLIDISDEADFSRRLDEIKNNAEIKNIKILYYSRFFLHSIDENIENLLLNVITKYLTKGDIFAAEFRTKEDENRYKAYDNHYRRFIDEKELLRKLKTKCNMTKVILFEKGTGFSKYKDEDPFLARIIVEKR